MKFTIPWVNSDAMQSVNCSEIGGPSLVQISFQPPGAESNYAAIQVLYSQVHSLCALIMHMMFEMEVSGSWVHFRHEIVLREEAVRVKPVAFHSPTCSLRSSSKAFQVWATANIFHFIFPSKSSENPTENAFSIAQMAQMCTQSHGSQISCKAHFDLHEFWFCSCHKAADFQVSITGEILREYDGMEW